MSTQTDFYKNSLNGNKLADVRRAVKKALKRADGAENIKQLAIDITLESFPENQPARAFVRYIVEEEMAGKDLPLDFVDAKD